MHWLTGGGKGQEDGKYCPFGDGFGLSAGVLLALFAPLDQEVKYTRAVHNVAVTFDDRFSQTGWLPRAPERYFAYRPTTWRTPPSWDSLGVSLPQVTGVSDKTAIKLYPSPHLKGVCCWTRKILKLFRWVNH